MAAECLSIFHCCNHSRKDLTNVARIHRISVRKACWTDSIDYTRGSLLLSILLLPKPVQSTVTGTLQATGLAVGKVYVEMTIHACIKSGLAAFYDEKAPGYMCAPHHGTNTA